MNNIPNKGRHFFVLLTVYCLLIVLTLAFIFGNSMMPIEESMEQSDKYVSSMKPILDPSGQLSYDIISPLIRKLAHVIEFAILGLELALLAFHISGGFRLRDSIYAAFGGLLCANTDEFIQSFSDRGSMVADVFLDFGGVILGIVGGYLLALAARGVRRRLSERKSAASAE